MRHQSMDGQYGPGQTGELKGKFKFLALRQATHSSALSDRQ